MKTTALWLPAALLLCVHAIALAAEPELAPFVAEPAETLWLDNYPRALQRAHEEHRLVLLNFTGSDWSTWGDQLRDEILTRNHFLDFAREHLVLVTIDFPRAVVQSKETQKQNAELAEKFGVKWFPTILLMDSEGNELGRTGYMQGGPKTFVRELKRLAAHPITSAAK